ncbi:beta-alanine-activating enzyme-like [Ruditapes philippinarum]|uniref:beta-alanine-activating enzyme-like n=1 Tax=Ruditapes philippinarum TaxID=129788 RepID=UPI00295B39EE|nr:beta-alanine-activating enzyme-like [Ruditapes philippinarum]
MVKMNSSLYNLVNKMIIKHPDRLAVQFDNGEQLSAISYTQLRNISSLVMKLLHGRDSEVIGLCLYTDHRLPAILLGVLGCKAAFYNFDAKGFMYARQVLKDVGTQILLVHKSFIQVIKNQIKEEEVVYTPVSVQGLEDYFVIQFTCIARKYCKSSLAYCITTSGTTGKPKVVMVPNECVVPNILHLSKLFSVTLDDLVLGATVLTFDPSIIEIFIALSVGACVLMVPPTVKMIPDRLLDIIHVRNKVTVIQVTPTLFSRFDASKLSDTILGDKSNVRVYCPWRREVPIMHLAAVNEVNRQPDMFL